MFQLCSLHHLMSRPILAMQPKRDYRELTGTEKLPKWNPKVPHDIVNITIKSLAWINRLRLRVLHSGDTIYGRVAI
jgi:hypothetical protein